MINSLDRPVIDTYINLLTLGIQSLPRSQFWPHYLLALSQQVILLSSEVTASLRSATVFADKVILVSSANILGAATRRQLGRSLMYIKKSKGPGMLTCGMPQVTVLAVDRLPFTLVPAQYAQLVLHQAKRTRRTKELQSLSAPRRLCALYTPVIQFASEET